MLQLVDRAVLRVKAAVGPTPRPTPEAPVIRDMARLLPGFREQVELVLADMRGAGFDPYVFETARSPERAAILAARGTGSLHSMHIYGAAADVIDAKLLWSARAAFWTSLTAFAEARGLTCGSRFKHLHDLPHIQAIPVAREWPVGGPVLGADPAVDAARDVFARQFYRTPA